MRIYGWMLTKAFEARPTQRADETGGKGSMDAKWNWLIDNVPARVVMNTLAWCLWLAIAMGVLELATKI